jgi:hypothetical protein
MKFSSNIGLKIHNRFDIQVKDAETMEVIQTAQAENIVLDRMYDRLLAFQSYFDQIVFGSGTGTLSASRTTLFTRIGNKAAVTESLVRSYPTSVWTRSIRLGTEEFNGQTIREVGISDTTTNINTHALITDSEGNPLSVEKTNLRIIDIYATVFVEVYSVDSGCFFYGNGLRDYLTGGSAPSNVIGLHDVINNEIEAITNLTATRTSNSSEKSLTLAVRFNVEHHNKDVRAIDWIGGGLRWLIPRTGVYTGTAKTNVPLGVGDGLNDTFELPNKEVTGLTVKVDGVTTTAYSIGFPYNVVFDTAPANGLLVTADYTTKYIPKDSDHVLDVTMKIQFGVSQPSPVMPAPDYSGLPGSNTLIGGDMNGGYFGEVAAVDFISGEDLCNAIGLTAGTLQNSDAGWLKYASDNQILYVAKKTFRYTISWNDINAKGAVWGEKLVQVGNYVFACRLLSSAEWNKLIYPVHANYGTWASFSNTELNITGNGGYTWTLTPSGSNRINRGYNSVEYSNAISPSTVATSHGFRPVLVYLYTLPS